MARFRHRPLDQTGQQIRLLYLLPGNGVINCHLRHAALTEQANAYEALSYCWGAGPTDAGYLRVMPARLYLAGETRPPCPAFLPRPETLDSSGDA